MGPITELTQNVTALQPGIAAAARIRDVDALEVEPDEPPAARAVAGDGPVLALRGVTAAYAPGRIPRRATSGSTCRGVATSRSWVPRARARRRC